MLIYEGYYVYLNILIACFQIIINLNSTMCIRIKH